MDAQRYIEGRSDLCWALLSQSYHLIHWDHAFCHCSQLYNSTISNKYRQMHSNIIKTPLY